MSNHNDKKIILDLCGGTGSWSEPYRKAGYDVHVITLPQYDILKTQISEDRIKFFDSSEAPFGRIVLARDIYGILAAPPCTMFSRARTTAKTPRDFVGAMKIVEMCLRIVWAARSAGSLEWWALENPMGMLRQFLGNPAHSFRGWEYGDDHVKFTDLWGYFKMPTKKIKSALPFDQKKYAAPKKPKSFEHLKLSRADIRAITPPGFAQAFFLANQ